jgi:glucose/arabinose dehydrogenase
MAPLTVAVLSGTGAKPFDVERSLNAPAGTTVQVWARIDNARFAAWTPAGDLLVSQPGRGTVLLLHPNGDGPPTQTTLVSGLTSPQGLAFDYLNGQEVLYIAESDAIVRYVWNGAGVGPPTSIVADLPSGSPYNHPLKAVAVAPDHTIYFDIGSSSNADPTDRERGEAQINSVRPDGSGRQVVMTGVRNGDGLAFDPTGQLWTAVNQRDQVSYPLPGSFGGDGDAYGKVIQEYVNDHPADEVVKVQPARDLGWPYCNPDQTLTNTPDDPYAQMAYRDDVEANGDGAFDCTSLPPVERGVPAHSAPLGLHFLAASTVPAAFRSGATLATHGSNNHVPPRAAALYWMPFSASSGLGAIQPLLTGFADSSGDRWGKPVDAVPGPDGALYVTDDTAGAVYRMVLPG